MPLSVVELFDARHLVTGRNASLDPARAMLGTDDESEAKAALLPAAPTSYGNSLSNPTNLVGQSVSLEPKGPDLWHATVRYGASEWNPL